MGTFPPPGSAGSALFVTQCACGAGRTSEGSKGVSALLLDGPLVVEVVAADGPAQGIAHKGEHCGREKGEERAGPGARVSPGLAGSSPQS